MSVSRWQMLKEQKFTTTLAKNSYFQIKEKKQATGMEEKEVWAQR
jgi:hypothetical protein